MEQAPSSSELRGYSWRFFRAGGFDQVLLASGDDLAHLERLDPKLWAALACPTRGLEFDSATLDLIDTDGDGRIRVPEVLAAVRWVLGVLRRPEILLASSDALPLAEIDDARPEGQELLASARQILTLVGKEGAPSIAVADLLETQSLSAKTPFNGDGVLPVESASDGLTRAALADVVATVGSEPDRSGRPGVTRARVDRFVEELEAYGAWLDAGQANAPEVLPLGPHTADAFEALCAVQAKIDDYFVRCRVAAFDPRAAKAVNRSEEELTLATAADFSADGAAFRSFPLALVGGCRPLPLDGGLNPAWEAAMVAFRRKTVEPFVGRVVKELTAEDWMAITARLEPYRDWLARKPAVAVEALGVQRIREILEGPALERIDVLLEREEAARAEASAMTAVERLVRYHRDLYRLLNNFVSFADFYRSRQAIFQVGTLYLDGRSCDLCVPVEDPEKHAVLASLGRMYLAYCTCTRKGSGEKMTIAAAFTNGDADQLRVGRNGIFYDADGQDWDATIVKIVEHPISIRQAVWAPYKRIARLVRDQIEKFAAARDKAGHDRVAGKLDDVAKDPGKAPATEAHAQGGIGNTVGVLAAVGLALGALGTAVATVFSAFLRLRWWEMPLALLGIFLLISGPSVLMAWLKLRARNLAPLLDANGWAVNGRVKITIPFGAALTQVAALPPGAARTLRDPYETRRWCFRPAVVVGAALLALLLLWAYRLAR